MTNGLNIIALTSTQQVRQFCINHDFYTRGTNKEYDELFDYVRQHPCMDEISLSVVINDIIKHSNIDLSDWLGIREDVVEDITGWFLTEACTIRYLRKQL